MTIAKKPSPPFDPLSVLSWMLMPSSVMLIAERGRPLMVAWRLPFGVETPGRRLTKSIALREVIGSLRIWFVFTVCETPDVCVCTISDARRDGDLLGDAADFHRRLHAGAGRPT